MVFKERPAGFNAACAVSGCFVEVNDEILFLLRNDDRPQPNTWCIPAGKCHVKEAFIKAAVRELFQETGHQARIEELCSAGTVYVRYPEVDFVYHMFRLKRGEKFDVRLNGEHKDYRWVTVKEALEMPLIPGEVECLRMVYGF